MLLKYFEHITHIWAGFWVWNGLGGKIFLGRVWFTKQSYTPVHIWYHTWTWWQNKFSLQFGAQTLRILENFLTAFNHQNIKEWRRDIGTTTPQYPISISKTTNNIIGQSSAVVSKYLRRVDFSRTSISSGENCLRLWSRLYFLVYD